MSSSEVASASAHWPFPIWVNMRSFLNISREKLVHYIFIFIFFIFTFYDWIDTLSHMDKIHFQKTAYMALSYSSNSFSYFSYRSSHGRMHTILLYYNFRDFSSYVVSIFTKAVHFPIVTYFSLPFGFKIICVPWAALWLRISFLSFDWMIGKIKELEDKVANLEQRVTALESK